MSCDEYQPMISKLLDGEVLPGASGVLFAHLASCGECQGFYHRMQALSASFDSLADRTFVSGGMESPPPRFRDTRAPAPLWKRRVPLRLPVLVLLLFAAAAGIFFSFSRHGPVRTTETVYITRYPAVVITDDAKQVD